MSFTDNARSVTPISSLLLFNVFRDENTSDKCFLHLLLWCSLSLFIISYLSSFPPNSQDPPPNVKYPCPFQSNLLSTVNLKYSELNFSFGFFYLFPNMTNLNFILDSPKTYKIKNYCKYCHNMKKRVNVSKLTREKVSWWVENPLS